MNYNTLYPIAFAFGATFITVPFWDSLANTVLFLPLAIGIAIHAVVYRYFNCTVLGHRVLETWIKDFINCTSLD